MQALGALNPLDLAEGQIQKQVGKFLGLKAQINQMRGNPQLNIRSQAEGLYTQQTQLEQELSMTLGNIERLKQGVWTISGVAGIANFALEMQQQINAVEQLSKKAQISDPGAGTQAEPISGMSMLTMVGLGLGALFLLRR